MTASAWIDYDSASETLLLSAGTEFLLSLASLVTSLESDGAEVRELTSLPSLDVRGDFRLILDPHDRNDGLREESEKPLQWRLTFSEEGWLEAAEKVEHVARSQTGHCYIQAIGPNDITFVISKGEYGPDGLHMPKS